MRQISNNLFYADENKVFQHIETEKIMGNGICLAEGDSIENYKEIDDPNPQPKTTPKQSRPRRPKMDKSNAPKGA